MKACVACALFLLLMPVIAGAAMNKCTDAAGRVTYTDKACAAGDSGSRTLVVPAAPRVTEPAAQPRTGRQAVPYKRPQRVDVPPLPAVDLSGLPRDAQGRPVLIRNGNASLVLDGKGGRQPVNVLAACSALVSRCVKPGERDLDACFMSAPRCASERPWEDKDFKPCCPTACWARYEARRIAGDSPLAAFDGSLFGGDGATGGCLAGK